MSRLAVYDSNAVVISFAALSLKDGRSEKFAKIEAVGPAYIIEGPGAAGQTTRCSTNNSVKKITLTFKGSSSENAKLAAIHQADRLAENGAGVAPLLIQDNNGSTLIATDRAWIEMDAEKEFGVSPSDVSWTIFAIVEPGPTAFIGGN